MKVKQGGSDNFCCSNFVRLQLFENVSRGGIDNQYGSFACDELEPFIRFIYVFL